MQRKTARRKEIESAVAEQRNRKSNEQKVKSYAVGNKFQLTHE